MECEKSVTGATITHLAFQSTHSKRDATTTQIFLISLDLFQSTHPKRDATLNMIKIYIILISNTPLTRKNF